MNNPILQPPTLLPQDSSDDLVAIRFDRARTELRHGRAIVVMTADPQAPVLLVAAIETLSMARLRWLNLSGAEPRLLLSAERLHALGWRDASTARSLHVAGPVTVELLQTLAAVSAGPADPGKLADPQIASPSMEAALGLAKRARLTPALWVAELPAARLAALEAAQVLPIAATDVAHMRRDGQPQLLRVSDAHVPIAAHEDCTLVLFRELDGDAEHVAVIVGQPDLSQPVRVRLHSSCLTGDLLGSLRCDCGDQLRRAIDVLAEAGGVLLYLAQEGRGTGLANKLRAYRLQDGGLDTIDADRHLGFSADERDFQAAVAMLEALGIARIRLLTNNPAKIASMRRGGIDVVDRLPLIAPINPHNSRYIRTKHERAGHLETEDEQD
ncbi:MAG: GTP cyclohydrolase II [Methylibium sp.]|nr:GTP cyclohydrolase II [Methylibium sp.]